jgi:hypothetical protein
MKFLTENTVFAQSYIEKRFPNVISTMDSFVVGSIDEYNAVVTGKKSTIDPLDKSK